MGFNPFILFWGIWVVSGMECGCGEWGWQRGLGVGRWDWGNREGGRGLEMGVWDCGFELGWLLTIFDNFGE